MRITRSTQHTTADVKAPPAPHAADEVMLETLAELAQFGLDAEARTLLERSDEGR
ncbi:MAG TPA: hypothetical protein VGQ25_04330 [Gemmatimonadales bacterium]|nr:hypothetical protein [Gemmatimonadales bacterium]